MVLMQGTEKCDAIFGIGIFFFAFGFSSVSLVTIRPLYAIAAAISQGSATDILPNQLSITAELYWEDREYT